MDNADDTILARFIVNGEELETREVPEEWLRKAAANRENVLLRDGNTYWIRGVEYLKDSTRPSARVDLAPPEFARAS